VAKGSTSAFHFAIVFATSGLGGIIASRVNDSVPSFSRGRSRERRRKRSKDGRTSASSKRPRMLCTITRPESSAITGVRGGLWRVV
jgi:hypothetical protein